MFKKYLTWSNALFAGLVIAMIIPQSRMFIQSNIQRIFLSSPSVSDSGENLKSDELSYGFLDGDGQYRKLSELQDKPVFLNFWATWCPPCVAEMPSIEKLYQDYKDKVHFIIVSNEEAETARQFLKKKGYTFPLASGVERPPETLHSSSIPATFILSRDGKILVSEIGASNWNSQKVRDLLDGEIDL